MRISPRWTSYLLSYGGDIAFGLFALQFLFVYRLIQFLDRIPFVVPPTPFDVAIPFVPVFIIPYALFVPMIIVAFYYSRRVPGGFNAAALAFLLTATTAHAFFLFFPTTMDRAALPPDGFFVDLVRFVYENDKPVNLFPSLHVAYTFLANGVLFHVHRRLAWWMVPVSVLIVLSTVFLKQHLLIDIVGGMMTGVLAYLVFKRVYAVQTTAAR